jgi:hypothetical protein
MLVLEHAPLVYQPLLVRGDLRALHQQPLERQHRGAQIHLHRELVPVGAPHVHHGAAAAAVHALRAVAPRPRRCALRLVPHRSLRASVQSTLANPPTPPPLPSPQSPNLNLPAPDLGADRCAETGTRTPRSEN